MKYNFDFDLYSEPHKIENLEALTIAAIGRLSDETNINYVFDFLEYLTDDLKFIESNNIANLDTIDTIVALKKYSAEYKNNRKIEEFSMAIDNLLE